MPNFSVSTNIIWNPVKLHIIVLDPEKYGGENVVFWCKKMINFFIGMSRQEREQGASVSFYREVTERLNREIITNSGLWGWGEGLGGYPGYYVRGL